MSRYTALTLFFWTRFCRSLTDPTKGDLDPFRKGATVYCFMKLISNFSEPDSQMDGASTGYPDTRLSDRTENRYSDQTARALHTVADTEGCVIPGVDQ